jgi:hypothetical protein
VSKNGCFFSLQRAICQSHDHNIGESMEDSYMVMESVERLVFATKTYTVWHTHTRLVLIPSFSVFRWFSRTFQSVPKQTETFTREVLGALRIQHLMTQSSSSKV